MISLSSFLKLSFYATFVVGFKTAAGRTNRKFLDFHVPEVKKGLYKCINAYFASIYSVPDQELEEISNSFGAMNFFELETTLHAPDAMDAFAFHAFQKCINESSIQEVINLSSSITAAHLGKIPELFQACQDSEKSEVDVEEILDSEHYLAIFKDFIPNNGPFKGLSFIQAITSHSFTSQQESHLLDKKLNALLLAYFDPFIGSDLFSESNFELAPHLVSMQNDKYIVSEEAVSLVLISASIRGKCDVLEFLLTSRRDISSKHAGMALVSASNSGRIQCATVLLENRGSLSCTMHFGKALVAASLNGRVDFVKLLLGKRMACYCNSNRYFTMALKRATESNHEECKNLLLDAQREDSAAYFDAFNLNLKRKQLDEATEEDMASQAFTEKKRKM